MPLGATLRAWFEPTTKHLHKEERKSRPTSQSTHSLRIDDHEAERQKREEVPRFSKERHALRLWRVERAPDDHWRPYDSNRYFCFYITDGKRVMAFGDGSLQDTAAISVIFHGNPKCPYPGGKFARTSSSGVPVTMSKAVQGRMEAVCGSRGYSELFRNSEHLCRFVLTGVWSSHETREGSPLHTLYAGGLSKAQRNLLNENPIEIDEWIRANEPPPRTIYEHRERPNGGHARYESPFVLESQPEVLEGPISENSLNVVIIGPTGSGKSSLINAMVNQTICPAARQVLSKTKNLRFYQATLNPAFVANVRADGQRLLPWPEFIWKKSNLRAPPHRVTFIDTIGFCDTSLTNEEVIHLLTEKIRLRLPRIHKVIIVCAATDRLRYSEAEAIKTFCNWLHLDKHPESRAVVATRADECQSEEDKREQLESICSLVGSSNVLISDENDRSFPRELAVGFDPKATHATQEIEGELARLHNAMLSASNDFQPIRTGSASCAIM